MMYNRKDSEERDMGIKYMQEIRITENEANQRLDRFLKKYLKSATLSYIYKAIRKDVKVNGKRVREDTVLLCGDNVALYISDGELASLSRRKEHERAKRQFSIAYEDENVLIVEKPFGLLVHGDKTEKKNTLTNQVISYLIENGSYVPRLEKTFVPSPVNRLDRNTTGLVIFGKNSQALQSLNEILRDKQCIRKFYWTVVSGNLKQDLHLVDRMEKDHQANRVAVTPAESGSGKLMETIARPVVYKNGYTFVEVQLVTGRTHQIRAHLQKAGYYVVGDDKYGKPAVNREFLKRYGLKAQFLHAYKLEFDESCPPVLNALRGKSITAQLPPNLQDIKKALFD